MHRIPDPERSERLLHALNRAVELGVMFILAVDAVDEVHYIRRRIRRAASGWWASVDRRERRRLHAAELGVLLPRRAARRGHDDVASATEA